MAGFINIKSIALDASNWVGLTVDNDCASVTIMNTSGQVLRLRHLGGVAEILVQDLTERTFGGSEKYGRIYSGQAFLQGRLQAGAGNVTLIS